MSVKETQEFRIPVSAEACYEALRRIASELRWKTLSEDKKSYTIKWQQVGFTSAGIKVTVSLEQLPSSDTLMIVLGELPGIALVDSFGYIPKALGQLLQPFHSVIKTAHMIQEGLLCPTCGKQLPAGSRFCPNDGTPISIECSKCGSVNPPSAQFCSACGAKLRDN